MKYLCIANVPPCDNCASGLMIKQVLESLPENNVSFCALMSRGLSPDIPQKWLAQDHLLLKRAFEGALNVFPGMLRYLSAVPFELSQYLYTKQVIFPKVLDFVNKQKPDKIIIFLQGQTTVRIADLLMQKTNIPIYTHTWDSLDWWLRARRIDKLSSHWILKQYDRVIKNSKSSSVASWGMSDLYQKKYNKTCPVIIDGLDKNLSISPAKMHENSSDTFTIAMAGQLYARAEWDILVDALNNVNWKLKGKQISLIVMGGSFYHETSTPTRITFLGWHDRENLVKTLSKSDLLYLPYWFSDNFLLESKTSFPSKLVSYFASGKPVLCHAPEYASPTKYIRANDAGFVCSKNEQASIIQAIEKAITNPSLAQKYAINGYNAFCKDLTLDVMGKNFLNSLNSD